MAWTVLLVAFIVLREVVGSFVGDLLPTNLNSLQDIINTVFGGFSLF